MPVTNRQTRIIGFGTQVQKVLQFVAQHLKFIFPLVSSRVLKSIQICALVVSVVYSANTHASRVFEEQLSNSCRGNDSREA